MGLHQPGIIKNSLLDQVNYLLSLWNPLEVPDYVTGTEYTDYVYDILDILKSRKNLEDYIYNDMFLGALGLGPSEWAKREISALCESIEKAYETIDVYQQGKGKRERLTFARKGPFLPVGPCLNQYNGWSAEKRAEVIEALTEKGIKVRLP